MFFRYLLKTSLDYNSCKIINKYANTDVYLYIHIVLNNYECMTSCLLSVYTWNYIKETSQFILDQPIIYTLNSDGINIKIESDINTILSNINVSYNKKDIISFKKLYPDRRFVGNFDIIKEIFKKCTQYTIKSQKGLSS